MEMPDSELLETICKAKVITCHTDSSEDGFLLELTQGRLPKPDGDFFNPGDRICCFIRSSDPGDICAYFESAYVSDGTFCKIAPYDAGQLREYVALPLRMRNENSFRIKCPA